MARMAFTFPLSFTLLSLLFFEYTVTVRYNRQTMAADKRSWVTEAIARIKRDIVIVEEKKRERQS